MTRGHVALRRAQLGCPVGAEAVDHHDVAQLGRVLLGGCVEVEQTLLDQLQAGRSCDCLGGREDGAHGVGLERLAGLGVADTARAFVDRAAAVGHRRRYPRHAGCACRHTIEYGVDCLLEFGHCLSPCC